MTTILRASGPAELLSIIPTLAGFTPQRSLVVLPFSGSRANGALRVDLPDDPAVVIEEFAATLIGLACRLPEVDAIAVAVYSDAAVDDDSALPYSELVDALLTRASVCALRIVEALCVGAHAWGNYRDHTASRVPLASIPSAPEVPGIADVSGNQASGSDLPTVDLAEKERVGHALRTLEQVIVRRMDATGTTAETTGSIDKDRVDPRIYLAALALDDLPGFFEEVLNTPENMSTFNTAALIWCLSRPLLRDVALVQWATDIEAGDEAFDAQLAFHQSRTEISNEIGDLMIGRGPRPDGDRLQIALAVTRNAAARAPRDQRVGPLSAAAWLSWALGRSTHADHYVNLAQQIDPAHSFSDILRQILDSGMLPEWAFHSRPTHAASHAI